MNLKIQQHVYAGLLEEAKRRGTTVPNLAREVLEIAAHLLITVNLYPPWGILMEIIMNKRASQNKPELWIEEDRRLFYADAITIKSTGECFKVEDKLAKIHTYMVDQYNSYRADGKSFYEDQRDIATKCKCTPKLLASG